MRVLVTGSRTWTDADEVAYALLKVYNEFGPFTLVTGACPQGADRIAEQVVTDWELSAMAVERYPAEWDKYGKSAGFIRNQMMVMTKPDLALAFLMDDSPGTKNTIRLCRAHGVPIQVFRRYSS